jgi:hypothetical protein
LRDNEGEVFVRGVYRGGQQATGHKNCGTHCDDGFQGFSHVANGNSGEAYIEAFSLGSLARAHVSHNLMLINSD